VVTDGSNGVNKKKFLGETTIVLYSDVSNPRKNEIAPQPVPSTTTLHGTIQSKWVPDRLSKQIEDQTLVIIIFHTSFYLDLVLIVAWDEFYK
jgi:hypothetical protein